MPIAWAKFMKTSAIEDPLLKVPPASRGNRTRARNRAPAAQPAPAAASCSQGEPNPCAVPPASRGEPKGGEQFINSEHAIGITKREVSLPHSARGRDREE